MSGHPFISVVIPVYNRAAFIAEAIDSVLIQNVEGVEIIVVDDGSTDTSADVVAGYGDRVRLIRQENAGCAAARNTGIEASRGTWIAALDSDDYWLPGKLVAQLRDLAAHPDAVAHFTNVISDRQFGKLSTNGADLVTLRGLEDFFGQEQRRFIERPFSFNLKHNFGRNQSSLIRRDALIAAGLYRPTQTNFFEDTDMMTRLALEGPWVVSKEVYVHELRREEDLEGMGTQMSKRRSAGYEALIRIYQNCLEDTRLTDEERQLTEAQIRRYSQYGAASLLREQDTRKARTLLRNAPSRSLRMYMLYGLSLLPPLLVRRVMKN